ncbi:DUF4872 domain-containing protein [Lentzea sp. NBRC 105346]|uniref:DUF4872 domain-containing protein n=1 Tax=Lentzea sp. NBRC 105346 TaxID=3032205 RepID=UPI0025561AE3|nr:DUF4872 domain-containing protein [Lentzea sp. NBRC 105346]
MTEQKSFKRLVRSRMERTGESYTTARRQLLREKPVLMHDTALLRHVLGGTMSEAMLAGLAGGIGFMYFVFEYKGLDAPTMTIVARHHPDPYIAAALRNSGIEHQVTTTGSVAKASKQLRGGGKLICTVDRTKLPWSGRTGEWGPEPYSVAVESVDGDTVLVRDDDAHPLPLNDFLTAWGKKHEMITITGTAAKPDVAAAVRTTVAHLTGPVLGNNFDVNFGFSGMRKLATEMRDVRGRKGWAQRWSTPGARAFVYQRLHDCIELEYTAPSATRPLYAEFLEEAGLPGAADFHASGRIWSEIAERALEASLAEGQTDLHVALADLVDEARELEEKAVGRL